MNNINMINCKLNISIDDVNPKPGWRILGEPVQTYLERLWNNYGAKTTLFIPANHHGDALITEHESWITELSSLPYIEIGAHGYYHKTDNPNSWGECEFGELTSEIQIQQRIVSIFKAWESVNIRPKIWKSPGWLTSRESSKQLSEWFDIAVIHPQHNHNLLWKCKTITATDYFPPNSFPGMDCNIFILSHIFGRHDNVWNENFHNWVCQVIEQLKTNTQLEYCFIKEF